MTTEPTTLAVKLETDDLERAGQFYDEITRELGFGRYHSWHRAIAWGVLGRFGLILEIPPPDRSARSSDGVVVCLSASSPEQVDRVFAIALAQGASTVLAPCDDAGYLACFRDLDGHTIEVHFGI